VRTAYVRRPHILFGLFSYTALESLWEDQVTVDDVCLLDTQIRVAQYFM